MPSRGVAISAGVEVDDDASFDYRVCGDNVEFEWGGRDGLYMVITEVGLENLISAATEALDAFREDEADET